MIPALPEAKLILSHNISLGIAELSLAVFYVSALLNSGTKRRKIVGVKLMAKEQRGCVTHLQKKTCLPQQGKMCWITLEIPTELLLLHISIISPALLEFLILNFVPILGRRLDITALYADGLIENCLPLACSSMIKLGRKIVGGLLQKVHKTPQLPESCQEGFQLCPGVETLPDSLSDGDFLFTGKWKENLHQCV